MCVFFHIYKLESSLTGYLLVQFVKDLSPSQINLSAIRGEGELTDLELNEVGRGKEEKRKR